ncbi:MAG: CoA transferase [Pseudomonadota bacterium]
MLTGLRVLDLTNVLAGPFCCHQLAHFGADVIKVEVPGRGDLARQLGADSDLNAASMGISFLAQNAGKRSITLNLKHPKGKALLTRLVKEADVLVENFRPGVMDRLGVGWEVLKAENPKLVYCAISGFGQDAPWAQRPAYDQIIQGASGVMSITGGVETAPQRVGYPVADTIGGLTAAMAICAALNNREEGAFIDVSMLESVLATMGWVVSNWLIGGVEPKPQGNENPTSAPSGAFATADKLLNIAANKQEQWLSLTDHLGRQELAEDPRFKTREDRKANRFDLKVELEKTLATKPAATWADEFNALGVPAGVIMDVPDILDDALIQTRGMLAHFAKTPGVDRPITVLRTGVKVDGEAPAVDTPPPALGEHNDEVYATLGITSEELESLKQEGIV